MDEVVQYLERCLELAEEALKAGNPPVGAVLIHNGIEIGQGIENARSTGDVTGHAEILALRDAVNKGNASLLSNATMFTTHEPCIMCAYAIRHYKIPKVVYGMAVEEIGSHTGHFPILTTTRVSKWSEYPEVKAGIMANECRSITERFQALLKK